MIRFLGLPALSLSMSNGLNFMSNPLSTSSVEHPSPGIESSRNLNERSELSWLLGLKATAQAMSGTRAIQQAHNRQILGDGYAPPEDEVISNNSPTTITHNYPAPAARGNSGWIVPALIGAALTATGIGASVGVPMVLDAIAAKAAEKVTPSIPVHPRPQAPVEGAQTGKAYDLDFF